MKDSFFRRYLLLSVKRTLKKPFHIVLLLCIPLLAFVFLYSAPKETRLLVAVYSDADSGLPFQVMEKLASRDGIYHFYISDSKDALYQEVVSGHAECGYIFPVDLSDKLNDGRKKNLVDLVVSSSTTMSKITNEIVYAELFEEYSLSILTDYLVSDSLLEDPDPATIETLYRKYLSNGSTFAFDVTGAYQDYSEIHESITLHMITGLTGILILLGGFSGLLQYADDNRKNIYENITHKNRKRLALLQITCPTLLFWLTGAFCFWMIGYFTDFTALLRYFCFGLLVLLLCMFFYCFLRFRMVLLTVLPLYLLGCLILTPVFLDITAYLPSLRFISRIFITYYLF